MAIQIASTPDRNELKHLFPNAYLKVETVETVVEIMATKAQTVVAIRAIRAFGALIVQGRIAKILVSTRIRLPVRP